METETVVLEYMYVYDNISVFPAKFVTRFPKFSNYLISLGYDYKILTQNNRILFVAVNSDKLITVDTFDDCTFFGFAIVNTLTRSLETIMAQENSKIIKIRLLDVVTNLFDTDLHVQLIIDNANFDVDVVFLVKYGFGEPKLVKNSYVVLKYFKRILPETTISVIQEIVGSIRSNLYTVKVFMPKVVAQMLSKCVKYINEASGIISLVKYDENGIGILGLNTENITEGGLAAVENPTQRAPFVFHSHPDKVTREYGAFISWPSGQDMKVVAQQYLADMDQLAHFVIGPEGIWVIHLTPGFQSILQILKRSENFNCGHAILEAIYQTFSKFDYDRDISTDPIDRYKASDKYMSAVKHYRLSKLFADVPPAKDICRPQLKEDVRLFDVNLLKWKMFDGEGVNLSFSYILDVRGGLSFFIFPYM
jgi:hypothetical protein